MERVGPVAANARMVGHLFGAAPSSMGYFRSPALHRRIRGKLAAHRFDLIVVHCSSVAPYVADVERIPKLLDFGDMDSQKWIAYSRFKPFPLSLAYWLEGSKLQRAEQRLARRFDTCTCTTRAEFETLESYATGVRTGWFPNGVDASAFQPSDEPYERDTICFVGRMDYYPNQECMFDFCERTFPRIRAKRPSVQLLIVGADPSRAVRRLGRLPGVTVTGSVDQVQPWVRRAALTVAPLNIARGTQNKILESLAMGVPCVCSRLAAKGVDAVPGEHLLAAEEPADYADAILRLLNDPAERRRFSEAGRKRMLSHHDWDQSMRRFDGIIESCMKEAASGSRAHGRSGR